jgi:hypothetical protein
MRCSKCRKPVKPVVALDIDGTLANYHRHFLDFAQAWKGEYISKVYKGDCSLAEHCEMDMRTYRECKLAYRQGGMKRSMPIFYGAESLPWALRNNGAEVWLTTTRPYLRMDNIDPDTREWCRRHGIEFDGLLYDEDKYLRLSEIVGSERIVAVLDDEPQNLFRSAALGLYSVWMRTQYNEFAIDPDSQGPPPWHLEVFSVEQAKKEILRRVEKWSTPILQQI